MLLSIALIVLTGIILSEITLKFGLPRIIGMVFTGILLGPYVLDLLDEDLLAISLDLRQLALVVILLRAGLSLDLEDLKKVGRPAVMLAFIPATLELVAVIVLAPLFLGFSLLEAAIMGTILAAVSPAIVVPRMLKMMRENKGTKERIPQMILAGASVDDVYVIVLFTAFIGVYNTGGEGLQAFLMLPLTLLGGVLLGVTTGLLFVKLFKHYHIRDTSKIMVLLAVAFLFITLEDSIAISGLLAIFTMGITILSKYDSLAKRLVFKYEKIWVFTELLLFVLVGVAVDITLLGSVGLLALFLILSALFIRSIGSFISTYKTHLTRKERVFVVFAYLPKATVQASIASIPLSMGINRGETMLAVAVLSILITAPLGAILTDRTQLLLLRKENHDT
jgi:NhaP-type Na+/H+ or K+/H+ antiporter